MRIVKVSDMTVLAWVQVHGNTALCACNMVTSGMAAWRRTKTKPLSEKGDIQDEGLGRVMADTPPPSLQLD